jgi:hypothetical protein
MGVTAGIFLASILLKEMRYLVYIRYLWLSHSLQTAIFLRSVRSSLTDLKNMTLDFASAFLSPGKNTTLDSKTRL